ncbi:hypothetical protein ACHAPT_013028 [Fusarium lateritium]
MLFSSLTKNAMAFKLTRDKTYLTQIRELANQELKGDSASHDDEMWTCVQHLRILVQGVDRFDLDDAKETAKALLPILMPRSGVNSPRVDAPTLLQLATGLREGALSEVTITADHPTDTRLFLQAFLEELHNENLATVDAMERFLQAEQRELGRGTVDEGMEDLDGLVRELSKVGDWETFRMTLLNINHHFYVRSHHACLHIMRRTREVADFAKVLGSLSKSEADDDEEMAEAKIE